MAKPLERDDDKLDYISTQRLSEFVRIPAKSNSIPV